MSKRRHKGSRFDEPFVGIVRSVFECPAFYKLSPFAHKLLFDLTGQYRGDNNGDLTAAWSQLSERGWRSRTTLYRAKKELIDAGFVYVTRKGRMPNTCELLALTWFPLDPSKKFDFDAMAGFRPKAYRDATPLPMPKIRKMPDWTQPNGGRPALEKQSPLSTSGTSRQLQVH